MFQVQVLKKAGICVDTWKWWSLIDRPVLNKLTLLNPILLRKQQCPLQIAQLLFITRWNLNQTMVPWFCCFQVLKWSIMQNFKCIQYTNWNLSLFENTNEWERNMFYTVVSYYWYINCYIYVLTHTHTHTNIVQVYTVNCM